MLSFRQKNIKFAADSFEPEEYSIDWDGIDPGAEPPKNRYARRQSVSAEPLAPSDEEDDDEEKIVYPKTDQQRIRLNEAVKNILLFKNLESEELTRVLDAMFEKKVTPDEHVIDQGDDGDNFYVVDSGTYDIFVKIDGADKNVGNYINKGSFGELALMYNTPRAATIVATSDGILWALDRVTFRKIVLRAASKKRKAYEALIEKVPMLSEINMSEKMNLADALESKTYDDGECIIKQGDEAEFMYFVEKGVVSIQILQPGESNEVEVATCTEGQYFGELALVTHKPRAASAYAVGLVRCAVLEIHAFERLLGPCMDIMKRNITNYEETLNNLGIEHTDLR
ncbi:cAMP-dependent protein kinase type II-alpha regulatory subunit-like isoform X2 [Dendronephthya gigantea]|uniref:cAMP-dependent protein kinase type II-alpha regulatory subunit-like isoform X2 n=1 Tax=Dendronephthya gigantea TaxID=151771 RepID=UPI001069F22A|nr:cAMP-dependent protein kinase type II-alpha regulatory subunit-like isoform X2 [Dendronephthya gigantea]